MIGTRALKIGSHWRGTLAMRLKEDEGCPIETCYSHGIYFCAVYPTVTRVRASTSKDHQTKWCACDRQTYCVIDDDEGPVVSEQNFYGRKIFSHVLLSLSFIGLRMFLRARAPCWVSKFIFWRNYSQSHRIRNRAFSLEFRITTIYFRTA